MASLYDNGIGVASPLKWPTGRNRGTRYGPGARGKSKPSLSGYAPKGTIANLGSPPSPDTPESPDTSMPDRPTGTKQVDRISRPSLFGDFNTTLGDTMAGTSYVRSSDPFLAFGEGFAGARSARAQREQLRYQQDVAAQDKAYQHDLDTAKLQDQQARTKAYQEAVLGKEKPLVDDKGNLTAEAHKQIAHELIALEKSYAGNPNMKPEDIAKILAERKAQMESDISNGIAPSTTEDEAAGASSDEPDPTGAAAMLPPDDSGGGGGFMGTVNAIGNKAIDAAEALGSAATGAAGGALKWAFGPNSNAPAPATPPPDLGTPPEPVAQNAPPTAGTPPASPPSAPAPYVAQPATTAPASGAANAGQQAAYAKARNLLSAGVPRAKVENALRQMGVDPSGL